MSQWKVLGSGGIYYVTTTIVNWNNVFTSEPYFEIIIQSLNYCMQQKELHLHGYVIMPNHAHYILSVDEKINLSDVMRDFKRHTSKAITDLLKNEKRQGILREFYQMADFDDRGNIYKVLQEGFHPITIESEKFFLEKLAYIHENPVRKGFIEKPEYWKYSSAKNYINEDHSIIRVECL